MATFYFDMDGTIANLYGVENWLEKLRDENPEPYYHAEPIFSAWVLSGIIRKLQEKGHKFGIVSWLSKNSSKEYKKAVRAAKRFWLESNFSVKWDEIHLIQYGTEKQKVIKDKNGYIFDDDIRVREKWFSSEKAINPTEVDIINFLRLFV